MLANGTAGQVLQSNGTTLAPTWVAAATGDVTLTGTQTLTNKTLTSPILTTPALGTPSALVGTNITGTAAGLSIGGNAATSTAQQPLPILLRVLLGQFHINLPLARLVCLTLERPDRYSLLMELVLLLGHLLRLTTVFLPMPLGLQY